MQRGRNGLREPHSIGAPLSSAGAAFLILLLDLRFGRFGEALGDASTSGSGSAGAGLGASSSLGGGVSSPAPAVLVMVS
eukprot:COSAG04_NODE_3801_length_2519_cov_1.782645_3_plen_79_part_00